MNRPMPLHLVGRLVGIRGKPPRVHPFVQQGDGLTLAPAVHAGKRENDLAPRLLQVFHLQAQQRLPQFRRLLLECLRTDGPAEFR
jgi:hypothetical protein